MDRTKFREDLVEILDEISLEKENDYNLIEEYLEKFRKRPFWMRWSIVVLEILFGVISIPLTGLTFLLMGVMYTVIGSFILGSIIVIIGCISSLFGYDVLSFR